MTAPARRPPANASDLNLKILWPLARWIEDEHGRATLRRVAHEAGLAVEMLDGRTRWVPLETVEVFLAGGRALAADDEAFVRACGHRMFEGYGVVRLMAFALSERQFFELAARASKVMTRMSRFEVLASSQSSFHVRYVTTRDESRLLCLSRQAAWLYGPTMWTMPPARLEELACVARGDACCEYRLRWFDRRRFLPIAASAAAGAGAGAALMAAHAPTTTALALPALGALLGWLHELRRVEGVNRTFAEQQHRVLREVAVAEAEARSELAALHERQREWTRLVEQHVADRTRAAQDVMTKLEALQQSRVRSLRGVSHDLRNPMSVVRGNAEYLRDFVGDPAGHEAIEDLLAAVDQMNEQIHRMQATLADERSSLRVPRRLEVAPLLDTLRRRLRALVFGRDVRVGVTATADAPEHVEVDPLVFDRITDNLLTNAAKYTERGSIQLEISGTPPRPDDVTPEGYLTLKLADTGRGIAPEDVERIFRPRPSKDQSPGSWGVGLSSVVQLLAEAGGRLDVTSVPGAGTTFWAHLPLRATGSDGADDLESMILRTVTIRRAEAS